AAVIARLAGMNLLRQSLELYRVRPIGQWIVLLLVEKLLAGVIDHTGGFLRAEHRVGIDLHALPRWWIRDVIGVPPLHLEIRERCATPPRHRDAVARHLARASRSGVQAIGVPCRENDGPTEHDQVLPPHDVERESPAD